MNYYTHARKLWNKYWRTVRAETMRNTYGTARHDTHAHAFALADIEPDTDNDTELDTAQAWDTPTRRDSLTLAEWRAMRGDSDANYGALDTPTDY
jgi:hypothetical protein